MIVYTGASGSIGSQMPPGVVPLRTRLEAPVADRVTELQALGGIPDGLIHLAALVPVGECEKDPQLAYTLNVEGSRRWFDAARQVGIRRFVYVSSAHVYAAPEGRTKLRTDSPVGPRSVYADTKLQGETELAAMAGASAVPRLTIARVFGVLSAAMRPTYLLTRLHERARNRDFSPIPGLSNVRDFMDARDIAAELVRLAQAATSPQIVHICSGHGTTVREVAERVFREHRLDPSTLTEAPGRPDDIPYLVGEPTPF